MPDTMTASPRMTGRTFGGPASRADHTEGAVARTIEQQTAKLPSDLFLWAAGASIVGSLCCKLSASASDFVCASAAARSESICLRSSCSLIVSC